MSKWTVVGVFIVFAGAYCFYLATPPRLQPGKIAIVEYLHDHDAADTIPNTISSTTTAATITTTLASATSTTHLPSSVPQQIFPKLHYLDDLKKFQVKYLSELRNPCWISRQVVRRESTSVVPQAQILANNSNMDTISFRSPENMRPHLRCLPYFFLIGQPKCGTTDIFQRIQYHPQVVSPMMKGPHWWSRSRLGPPFASKMVSFNEYVDLFNNISTQIMHDMLEDKAKNQSDSVQAHEGNFRNAQHLSGSESSQPGGVLETQDVSKKKVGSEAYRQFITGDASPSTMWDSGPTIQLLQGKVKGKGLRGSKLRNELLRDRGLTLEDFVKSGGTILTTADVLHHYLPDSKIIIVLREPVSRLFSSYLFFTTKYKPSAEDFHERVEMTLDLWDQCVSRESQQNCVYNKTLQQSMGVRLHNGLYSIFLKDWLQVFPKEQVLVLRLEDYKKDLAGTLTKIYQHLELRTLTPEEELTVASAPVKNKSKKKNDVGHMHNETRTLLRRFYEPFNRELAFLLSDLGFVWEDVYSTW